MQDYAIIRNRGESPHALRVARWLLAVALATSLSPLATLAQEARPGAAAQQLGADSAAAGEVERLRELLRRYEEASGAAGVAPAEDGTAEANGSADRSALDTAPSPDTAPGPDTAYSADKVLLDSADLPLLIGQVQRRLDNPLLTDRRNDAALVGSVQTRRRGALVASSNFGLRHIGRHQFLGVGELQRGSNTLVTSGEEWRIELPEGEPAAYLILLFAPPLAEWQLHVVPERAVAALAGEIPSWLETFFVDSGSAR